MKPPFARTPLDASIVAAVYKRVITLDEVRQERPAMVFYGANTCWWTHDPAHLSRTPPVNEHEVRQLAETMRGMSASPNAPLDDFMARARLAASHQMPCDPRGGMLLQTNDVAGFLRAAAKQPNYYGRHGLTAFEAAHHLNVTLHGHPWCFEGWESYNTLIDRAARMS